MYRVIQNSPDLLLSIRSLIQSSLGVLNLILKFNNDFKNTHISWVLKRGDGNIFSLKALS